MEIPGGGHYLGNGGNYRPGQLIPHGTFIDFECDELKSTGTDGRPLRCERGMLLPEKPGGQVCSFLPRYSRHKHNMNKYTIFFFDRVLHGI